MTSRGKEKAGSAVLSGLRTRFYPKSRIGHGLISVGPWVDIVLIIVLFALLSGRVVVQPGVTVELPFGRPKEATALGLMAVVLSVKGVSGTEQMVFFDDERFIVGQESQMAGLRRALKESRGKHPEAGLTIQADRRVEHGTVMDLMNMALDAGIQEVNIAVRAF